MGYNPGRAPGAAGVYLAGRMSRSSSAQRALMFVLIGALALTLLYPIALTLRTGFAEDAATNRGWTLRHLLLVARDPVLRAGLLNALGLAAATTAISAVLALPLAVLSTRYRFPLKGVWNGAVLVPLILPPFVGAIGLKAILGRSGALNALLGTDWDVLGAARFWGVAVALALHLYPILYLNASAALANLNPALDEAARVFAIPRWRRFTSITLPLIRPGVFAGGAIVFIWSFTELGTPLVFDYYQVTSVQIFNGIKRMDASAEPYALTAVMLTVAIVTYLLGKTLLGHDAHAASTRAATASAERPLGLSAGLGATGLFAIVTALAVVPHLGVVLKAFAVPGAWYRDVLPSAWTTHNFEQALTHPLAAGSISNSILLASSAAIVDVLLGLVIGYLIARSTLRSRHLLDSMAMLPLAVPGLVLAFGYIALTLRWPFGRGDPLEGVVDVVGANPNPIPLLILAYAVRRLPYVVRATVAGLQQIGPEVEEAARVFGAGPVRAVRSATLPLIAANLFAGALLAFSFAMLEVSDSLVLAQQERHYPITKAIYTFIERLGDGAYIASAMGVWGMLLLTLTLVGVSILLGRALGAVFRA